MVFRFAKKQKQKTCTRILNTSRLIVGGGGGDLVVKCALKIFLIEDMTWEENVILLR